MQVAIQLDKFYQHRHLIISYTESMHLPCTRKELSEYTAVPINAVSKVVSGLIEEGALLDLHTGHSPHDGKLSNVLDVSMALIAPPFYAQ